VLRANRLEELGQLGLVREVWVGCLADDLAVGAVPVEPDDLPQALGMAGDPQLQHRLVGARSHRPATRFGCGPAAG
jgi:hypothetical protein